jgi:hypothetical protein
MTHKQCSVCTHKGEIYDEKRNELFCCSTCQTVGQASPAFKLHNAMRKLWEDHIQWTRNFIISFTHGLPDLDEVGKRLHQNQADLGNAFGLYYGEKVASTVTALLNEHIDGAGKILAEAKGGGAGVGAAVEAWRVNGRAIARALHLLNPKHWRESVLQEAMKKHLDDTLSEATHRLGGQYSADIADYERVHLHILAMADILTVGLISQFPERF